MNIKTAWLTIESVIMIIMVMFFTELFWTYINYPIIIKALLTFLGMIIIFDIFRGYLRTKWILIKEESK